MLRFYTYYSVGGYKDLYLGNSGMGDDFTYFLPLLGRQRKQAETDGNGQLAERVKYLDALPKILLVNQASPHGFPGAASRLVSHGGYRLVYAQVAGDSYVLVLRDILGVNKDESGRPIPFLMMIVADNVQDGRKLATVAAFWGNHIGSVSDKIASMLLYDKDVNGIKFCLKQFNAFVEDCADRQDYVETALGKTAVLTESDTAGILMMPSELYTKQAVEDLGLRNKCIKHIPLEQVLPLDNPDKAAQMRAKARIAMRVGKRKVLFAGIVALVIIIVFVLLRSALK